MTSPIANFTAILAWSTAAVPRLEHADQQQPRHERRADAVAHQRVDHLLRRPGLHEQPAEEGREAEDVDEQQHQPQGLHARSVVGPPAGGAAQPRSARSAARPVRPLVLGAGRTTSTGQGA